MMTSRRGIHTLKCLSGFVEIKMELNPCPTASSYHHLISIVSSHMCRKLFAITTKTVSLFRRVGRILPSQEKFTCNKAGENVRHGIFACVAALMVDTLVRFHQLYHGLRKPETLLSGRIPWFTLLYTTTNWVKLQVSGSLMQTPRKQRTISPG